MRSASDFRRTIRAGVRSGRPTLVVSADGGRDESGVLVGFVVAKSVGNAVIRNRVRRRLRHLSQPLLRDTPGGTRVVVRALPPAAESDRDLAVDLSGAWQTCLKRLSSRTSRTPVGGQA